MTSPNHSFDPLNEAQGLSSATLHEAYTRRGALPGGIKAIDKGMRICGPAFTARCAPGDNLRIHEAIYAAPRGSVLVVDVGEGTAYGYWGEITTEAAVAVGLTGLVINGGVRDAEEISAIGFPVFAKGLDIRGTSKDPAADGSVGEAVTIGNVVIECGDLIVGDRDGVVAVRRADVPAVVDAARRREAAERRSIESIRAGERTIDRIRERMKQP